jgi:hypothetical protein
MAVPQSQMAPVSMPPRQHSGQDWATARLGSAGSESSFSLPLTAWRLGSGPEGVRAFSVLHMVPCILHLKAGYVNI